MNICFVTGNKNKVREVEEILETKLENVSLELDEIQEIDAHKVIEHKLKQAYEKIGKPVLVEDTSLYISCLNDFPGPLVKWFWQTVTLDKICQMAICLKDNKVTAKAIFGYFDGKEVNFFEGVIKGSLPLEPKGENGFGWDPIFIPVGHKKTFAEMNAEEKNLVSMRKLALEKLREYFSGSYK